MSDVKEAIFVGLLCGISYVAGVMIGGHAATKGKLEIRIVDKKHKDKDEE